MTAHDPRCGRLAAEVIGRLPNGWVRIQIAGQSPGTWYCGLRCASLGLPGVSGARLDVATCPICAARHDLQHTCRSCGHRPPPLLYGRTA